MYIPVCIYIYEKNQIHTAPNGKFALLVSCIEKNLGTFWNRNYISKSGTKIYTSYNCLQMEIMWYKKETNQLLIIAAHLYTPGENVE